MNRLIAGRFADCGKRFSCKTLEKGTQHEFEHTDNRIVAQKIALDHLREHPDYYDKLPKFEKSLKK